MFRAAKFTKQPSRQFSTASPTGSANQTSFKDVLKPKETMRGANVNSTLFQVFEQKVEQYEHRDFLSVPFDKTRWTYVELKDFVESYGAGLADHGFQRGKRLAVMLPEGNEAVGLQIAFASLGTVQTMFNTSSTTAQFSQLMDFTKVDSLIWMPDSYSLDIFEELCKEIPEFVNYPREYRTGRWRCTRFPYLEQVISTDIYPFFAQGFIKLEEIWSDRMIPNPMYEVTPTLRPSDAIYMHTEFGADGKPLGRVYTHSDFLATANCAGERLKLDVGDRVAISLRLQSELGFAISIWSALTHGAFVVIPTYNWHPEEHLRQAHEEHCNAIISTPKNIQEMITHENFGKYNLSRITKVLLVTDSPISPELSSALKAKNWTVSTMSAREKAKPTNFVTPVRVRMGFID